MSESSIMKCGHRANALLTRPDGAKVPICVICYGIKAGADEVAVPQPPQPKGYRCPHCKRISEKPVAFSSPVLDKDGYGSHYDGCRGWD